MKLLIIAKVLSIIALVLQVISVFLPYDVKTNTYGTFEKTYESGIDLIAPLFAILYFLVLMVLHFIKHSLPSKIIVLVLAILAVFPGSLIILFVSTFSLGSQRTITIGFFLFAFAVFLSFGASILKMIVKVNRPKGLQSDLLDSF